MVLLPAPPLILPCLSPTHPPQTHFPAKRTFASGPSGGGFFDRLFAFTAGFGACALVGSFFIYDELRSSNDKIFKKLNIKK